MENLIFNQCCPETTHGFFDILLKYIIEIGPALIVGFLLSGIINELISDEWITEHLGGSGLKPIFIATIVGAVLPICCWGTLPLAVSFHKKGARLGPILAFMVATPATSISAFLVTWSVLGLRFAVYISIAVVIMGVIMGLVGNLFALTDGAENSKPACHCCDDDKKRTFQQHVTSILKYAFVDMLKDIGLETAIGIVIAAIIASVDPVGRLVTLYLGGFNGYIFSLVFGILMYICSTSSPAMVDAFLKRGMVPGAGMVLLLVGPVTSYGTILVVRKKFGYKVLFVFILVISILSLLSGYIYQLLQLLGSGLKN